MQSSFEALRLKICSVTLFQALNLACSSMIISLTCGLSHFQDDPQHDHLTRTADKADGFVFLRAVSRQFQGRRVVEWLEDSDNGAEGRGFESLSVNPAVIEYLLLKS